MDVGTPTIMSPALLPFHRHWLANPRARPRVAPRERRFHWNHSRRRGRRGRIPGRGRDVHRDGLGDPRRRRRRVRRCGRSAGGASTTATNRESSDRPHAAATARCPCYHAVTASRVRRSKMSASGSSRRAVARTSRTDRRPRRAQIDGDSAGRSAFATRTRARRCPARTARSLHGGARRHVSE